MPKNTYPDTVVYFGQTFQFKISMKPEFKIERKAMRLLSFEEADNIYLSKEKQDMCTLKYSEIYQTFVTQDNQMVADREYNFVLTCEPHPRLLISEYLHHSSLANGKKVLASGSLFFSDGNLYKITNHSGHYRPTDEEMLGVIKALYVASNGSLKKYQSYSSQRALIYPVNELINAESFTQVSPLAITEMIDDASGKRVECGYDLRIENSSRQKNHYGAG